MIQNIDTNDKIIKITNLICCKIFENTSYLYHYYKKFDMENEIDQISDIIVDIKNNKITEENFNFIITVIADLLVELKANIVRLEENNIFYKELTINYLEEIKSLKESNNVKTEQIKTWIMKNIDSNSIIKDLEQKLKTIELDNNTNTELNNLVSRLQNNNKTLNEKYIELETKLLKTKLDNEKFKKDFNMKLSKLTEQNTNLLDQINIKNEEINKLKNNLKEIIKENNDIKNNYDELNNDYNDIKNNYDELNNEYNDIKNNYDELNNEYNNFYQYYSQLNYYPPIIYINGMLYYHY